MKIIKLICLVLSIFTINTCKANPNSGNIVDRVDTIKKAEIIRRATLFDRKDTNTRVGKCYLKINENIALTVEVEPKEVVDEWLLPFALKDRTDTTQIKITSPFGANRSSHLRGHKHTGDDIVPKHYDTGVYVYPVAKGIICFKKIKDPFSSVIIKHRLADSTFIFTSYIHLKEIYVANGDTVDTKTKIGKLFNRREVRKFRGPYDHLHFEVRKTFDDFGFASSHCMNRSELDSFFHEPVKFLGEKIKVGLAQKTIKK